MVADAPQHAREQHAEEDESKSEGEQRGDQQQRHAEGAHGDDDEPVGNQAQQRGVPCAALEAVAPGAEQGPAHRIPAGSQIALRPT